MKIAVLVSGGGTNLQAIMDSIDNGVITNTSIEVVISNKKDAYALERAANKGIANVCISPKDYDKREDFNQKLLD
ncbi:MAG: phosphoribosylglycinamide formyltransferase, partial [Clostridium sp.]|nr:phosphoribosylglycinamide formyltransferase [Clostridium sp.]